MRKLTYDRPCKVCWRFGVFTCMILHNAYPPTHYSRHREERSDAAISTPTMSS